MINDASVVIGGGNWGIKEADVLGYKLINGKYYARDIDFANSTAAGTYTDSTGVVRKAPYNLVTFSEMFTDSTWGKVASSITANTTTAPNGTLTADTWTGNGLSSAKYVLQQSPIVSGISYSISVYAKKNTNNFIVLYGANVTFGPNAYANFDLNNGVVGTVGASATATIENAGNGWYRCIIRATSTATTTDVATAFGLITSATSPPDEVNTLSTSVFLWGAQLVEGSSALSYFPTTTRLNVPRIDYRNADGSLSTTGRLLLEPQRTNSFLRSEEFNNASWSNTGSTIIANDTTSPSGVQNADRITTTGGLQIVNQSPSLTVGQPFVFSVFAKAGNWGIVRIGNVSSATSGAWFDVSNGTTGTINGGTSEIINYGNGWYRLIARFTSFATGSSFIGISDANGSTTAPAVGSFMYLWGAQIEAGSYATSYIPTTTAAVTRNADSASRTGVSSWIGQTEGTLFAELNTNRTGVNQHIELGDGTTNNRVTVRFTLSNTFQLVIVQGAAVVYNQISATTFAQGQRVKIAAAYKSGAATNIYVNGVSVTSATAGTITGNLTGIYMTSFGAGATDPLFSPITQVALFPTRLDNATLEQLTTI